MCVPNLDKLTPEDLLSSASLMDWFTVRMSHMKMMNMSGSAFRKHPQMYWKDGILLTNHWRTSGDTDIKIASDLAATCIRGMDESCAYGDPYPSLSSGQFACVWQCGRWLLEGPWQEPIRSHLKTLIERMCEAIRLKEESEAAERKRYELEKQAREADFLTAWAK